MEIKEQMNICKKEKWFDVHFIIEALSISEDVVKSALEKHVDKLSHMRDILVYDKKFSEIKSVENPLKGVETGYSYFVNVKLFAKTLSVLLNSVLMYGPSSIEVMGPDKKEISISESQDICNVLAGIVHQFAAAGIGGIVITPDEKKQLR